MKIIEGLTETLKSKIKKFLDLETKVETQSKSKYYQIPYDSFGAPILPGISDALKIDYDVMVRYADYDDMDDYPIISTAFDIYADDCCQIDLLRNSTVWGESESSEIKKLINELLNNRLNIEDTIWELVRNLVKYGNDFEELLVSNRGVEGWVYIPTPLMRRVEQNRNLLGFIQDTTGNYMIGSTQYLESMLRYLSSDKSQYNFGNLVFFEPNEIQHFRLLSKQRSGVYGFGVGEPARWIFKRLVLLQDSMIMHKLTRATSRLVFYIDAGETNFIDAMKYADMVRQRYKRKKYVDPNTGKLDLRYNPLCLTLDTKIPLLDGRTETLQTLIDEYSQGKQNYVYSIDPETKQIHAGKIVWAGVTRRNAQLVRVTLDNGQQIKCTPDHKFMIRSGEYIEAQYLQSGMSLMPLYRCVYGKGNNKHQSVLHLDRHNHWESTHAIVGRDLFNWEKKSDMVVHHKDHNGLNNHPDNLQYVSIIEHRKLHIDLAQKTILRPEIQRKSVETRLNRLKNPEYRSQLSEKISRGVRRFRKCNPEKAQQMNEIARKSILKWNYSSEHSKVVVETNIKYNKSAVARQKANTPLQREKARQHLKNLATNLWKDPIYRAKKSLQVKLMMQEWWDAYHHWKQFNPEGNPKIFRNIFGSPGKSFVYTNHKVVKVEWLEEREDTGCITVEPYHNFALDVGIFVKNSDDEDFFIPVVGGRETTRIDSLGGLDYQNIDVVEYFDKLLYSALKIPKSYLSFDEDVKGKAVLSMEDIRFARTIMRIQRILKTGLNRIVTLHLCLLGIDPISVDYDIGMTIPSAILELAQLEAMNAKIDFASKFGDYVSSYWILSHIFGFTDNQIEKIYEQKAMDLYYSEKVEYDAKKRFEEYREKMEADRMAKQPKKGEGGSNEVGLEGEEGGEEFGGDFVSFEDKDIDDKYHGWLFEKKLRKLGKEKDSKKRRISVDEIMDGVMKGNREFEKRLEDKLDDILKENDDLRNRIERLSGFMEDLRLNIGGSRK